MGRSFLVCNSLSFSLLLLHSLTFGIYLSFFPFHSVFFLWPIIFRDIISVLLLQIHYHYLILSIELVVQGICIETDTPKEDLRGISKIYYLYPQA